MQPRWPQIQPTTPAAEHQPKCRGQGLVLLAVGANEARKSIGTFLFEFCAYKRGLSLHVLLSLPFEYALRNEFPFNSSGLVERVGFSAQRAFIECLNVSGVALAKGLDLATHSEW
jgi:hypothetical protein